jgi:hypothetical protein
LFSAATSKDRTRGIPRIRMRGTSRRAGGDCLLVRLFFRAVNENAEGNGKAFP